MLEAKAFIPCGKIDDVYFDKPYFVVPVEDEDHDAFISSQDAVIKARATAIARTVVFRRIRIVLIRANGNAP